MIRAYACGAKLFEHELTTCTLRTYRVLRVSYIPIYVWFIFNFRDDQGLRLRGIPEEMRQTRLCSFDAITV